MGPFGNLRIIFDRLLERVGVQDTGTRISHTPEVYKQTKGQVILQKLKYVCA